ncbi:MAG TPA: phage baseplate protein [Thermoanaerobaculia bacterium]|nr:phage baseplate protein [Thermoanaerobaculia bacterium]
MRPLTASAVLRIWEQGQRGHSVNKALALLAAALPNRTFAELADLSLGMRDALLLRLRERTIGSEIKGYTACPRCGVITDFTLSVQDLLVAAPDPPREEVFAAGGGWEIRFRPVTSRDLEAVSRAGDVEAARALLVRRVVLEAVHEERRVDPRDLPEEAVLALATRLEELDPQAELPLALACGACKHEWLALFEAGTFFWTEINALAERVLNEVHVLAHFYGWSEAEILALSAVRRQYYLDLIPTNA